MPIKNFKKDHENEIQNIKTSNEIIEENKKTLKKFYRDLKVKDYSDSRILKLINYTKLLAKQINKPFQETTKEDIKDLVAWINQRNLADSTKRTYKVILKVFYKWLNDGSHPEKVEWIKTSTSKNNKLPKELLREKDIKKLLSGAENPRTKALISLLWETGARIGELIDLKIGDIEDHEHGKQIIIDGKTGQRRIPLIESVPHLRNWLNLHPEPEPENPIWVNVGNTRHGKKSSYRNLRKSLETAKKRAKLEEKPVNPHHFRHSRATYLANKFTEAQMCQFFGWVQGSDMPSKYIHLSGRDIDEAYAQLHGLEDENKKESNLTPKTCPRCKNQNPHDANLCSYCGQALSHEEFRKFEKAKEDQEEIDVDKQKLISLIQDYEENGKISKELLEKLL
ncbi:integrase [archaeon SCG-AAA382B04]|nr:integrase [archaeon SCG-AAA382B04]